MVAEHAHALGDSEVRPEHILLGLLADDSDPVPHTLRRLGLDPATVRGRLIDELQQAA